MANLKPLLKSFAPFAKTIAKTLANRQASVWHVTRCGLSYPPF